MTRTMYDSTNPGAIPASAALVAGYVDGLYRWSDAAWARFAGVRPTCSNTNPYRAR